MAVLHPQDDRIRPPRRFFSRKQRGGRSGTAVAATRASSRNQAAIKGQQSQTQRARRDAAVQQKANKSAANRLNEAQLAGVVVSQQIEGGPKVSQRDVKAAEDQLAASQIKGVTGRIQEERQRASNQMSQDRVEVEVVATNNLSFNQNTLDTLVQQRQEELRTEAIARETAYYRAQIWAIRNKSVAEKNATLLRMRQEITANYDALVRKQLISALDKIKSDMSQMRKSVIQNSAIPAATLSVLRSQMPNMKDQIRSYVDGINAATKIISKSALQALVELSKLTSSIGKNANEAQALVAKLNTIVANYGLIVNSLSQANTTIPGLNQARDSLLGQLNALRPSIIELAATVSAIQDSNGVEAGRAVWNALTKIKIDVESDIKTTSDSITSNFSQLERANRDAAAATAAREAAEQNQDAAFVAAQGQEAQDIRAVEGPYAETKAKVDGLQGTTDSIGRTRDGFQTEADGLLGDHTTAMTLYQTPAQTELDTFTRTTVTPAKNAFDATTKKLQDSQTGISIIDQNVSALQTQLSILAPKIAGGYPTKPAVLVNLDQQATYLFTTLTSTFPSMISGLVTRANSLFWSAGLILSLVTGPNGIYFVAETISKPPSDVAMNGWINAKSYLSNYLGTIKTLGSGLATSIQTVKSYNKTIARQRNLLYRALFRLQYNKFGLDLNSAKGIKERANPQAIRDTVSNQTGTMANFRENIRSIEGTLIDIGTTGDAITRIDESIRVFVVNLAKNDATLMLVTLHWERYVIVSTFLNPQIGRVQYDGNQIRTFTGDSSNLVLLLSRLLTNRQNADRTLSDAFRDRTDRIRTRNGLLARAPILELQRSQLIFLLNARSDRSTALVMYSGTKTQSKGAYFFFNEQKFPRFTPTRPSVRDTLTNMDSLTNNLGEKPGVDSQLSTLDSTTLPNAVAKFLEAFRNRMDYSSIQGLALAQFYMGIIGLVQQLAGYKWTDVTTQSGVVRGIGTRLAGYLSDSPNVYALMDQLFIRRKNAFSPLDFSKGQVTILSNTRDDYLDRVFDLTVAKNGLMNLRDTLKRKGDYAKIFTQTRDNFKTQFTNSNTERLAANRNKSPVSNMDYIPTISFFNNITDITQRASDLYNLPIPPADDDPPLVRARGDKTRYKGILDGLWATYQKAGLNQGQLEAFGIYTGAKQQRDAFWQNFLSPQINLVVYDSTVGSTLSPLGLLLGQLAEALRIARGNLQTAKDTIVMLTAFGKYFSILTNFTETKSARIMNLNRYLGTRNVFKGRYEIQAGPFPRPTTPSRIIQGFQDNLESLNSNQSEFDGIPGKLQNVDSLSPIAKDTLAEYRYQKGLLDAGTDPNKISALEFKYRYDLLKTPRDNAFILYDGQLTIVRNNGTASSQLLPNVTEMWNKLQAALQNLDSARNPRDERIRKRQGLRNEEAFLTRMRDVLFAAMSRVEGVQGQELNLFRGSKSKYQGLYGTLNTARETAKNRPLTPSRIIQGFQSNLESLNLNQSEIDGIPSQISTIDESFKGPRDDLKYYRYQKGLLDAGTDPNKISALEIKYLYDLLKTPRDDAFILYDGQLTVVRNNGTASSQLLPNVTEMWNKLQAALQNLDSARNPRDERIRKRQGLRNEEAFLRFMRDTIFNALQTTEDTQGKELAVFNGTKAAQKALYDSCNTARQEAQNRPLTPSRTIQGFQSNLESLNSNQSEIDGIPSQISTIDESFKGPRDDLKYYRYQKGLLDAGTDPNKISALEFKYLYDLLKTPRDDAFILYDGQLTIVRNDGIASSELLPDLAAMWDRLQEAQGNLNDAIVPRDIFIGDKNKIDARIALLQSYLDQMYSVRDTESVQGQQTRVFEGLRNAFKIQYDLLGSNTFDKPTIERDLTQSELVLDTIDSLTQNIDELASMDAIDTSEYDGVQLLYANLRDMAHANMLYSMVLDLQRLIGDINDDLQTQDGIVNNDGTTIGNLFGDSSTLSDLLSDLAEKLRQAKQTLDDTIRDRDGAISMRQTILDLKEKMYTLRDVLRSYYDVASSRYNTQMYYSGRAKYYKGLYDLYYLDKIEAEGIKVDATIDLGTLVSSIQSNSSQLLENANNLESTLDLMDDVNQQLEQNRERLEGLQDELEEYILQKEFGDAKKALAEMLRIQREMNLLNEKMNRIMISLEALREQLADSGLDLSNLLAILLDNMLRNRKQLDEMQKAIEDARDKISILQKEIIALQEFQKELKGKLPIVGFAVFPIAPIVTAGILLGGVLLFNPFAPPPTKPKPTDADCANAKTRGYRDGYQAGKRAGYNRGYADAKADFDKYSRRFLATSLQQSAQAAPSRQAEDDTYADEQYGGQPVDDEPVYDDEAAVAPEAQTKRDTTPPLMDIPSSYRPYPPAVTPVPPDGGIVVPRLPNVNDEYQACYEQGYRAGFKQAFSDYYLQGFYSFNPSQTAFLPPLQPGEEEEEEPTEPAPVSKPDEFGYAPRGVSQAGPSFADGAPPPAVPRDITMDESYRNQYNQMRMSQF